ncbi:choice-of-anchor F family protein [Sulfurovum sp.]|uniref:choice-of-anchor F family protein n=1 Tax=Sulfurovum sp. TaxID=1969726 RepID=UPI003566C0BE
MNKNIVKMSLVTAMLLSSGAYAGNIIGANPGDTVEPLEQFGFGGWNLTNVMVNITDTEYVLNPNLTFNSDGTYDEMTYGDSFESIITTNGLVTGKLHGKDWPVGEPAGIKIINGDTKASKGKPGNCILTTSYLSAENNLPSLENGYLDGDDPAPVICSSPFQTHKRFKVNMTEASTEDYNTTTGYGKPIDLVFNLDGTDMNMENVRYQVFQKINNYTGMRLDGYKVEVLDENGTVKANDLTLSIGLDEALTGGDNPQPDGDIWDVEDMANYSHGLWGPQTFEEPDPHFPTDGFFDSKRAGFVVDPAGHGTPTLEGGPTTLGSNYVDLFGLWLPSKWQPIGIFFDNDNNPLTDAELVAFWGTVPNAETGTLPAWHKGKDYDLSDGDQSWAEPTVEELLTWISDPLYAQGHIEDTLNLGLNYIVNVGENSNIGDTFTVRITPRVAAEQTAPNYIMDDNETYIEPPSGYDDAEKILIISPAPYFAPGADLHVGLADTELNTDDQNADETIIVLTSDNGDEENLTLTETDANSSIFVGTIGTNTDPAADDGEMNVVDGTVVTATYEANATLTLTATTTAEDGTVTPPVVTPPSSGGGGGCTYNPNSKNFDMTFLMLMALGLLYPFRRRFLK